MPRGALLTANLPQLQNLIKRDPEGYKEEFLQQWTHFQSVYQIFQSNPLEQPEHFRETVAFLSQVASCYPVETKDFPSKLSSLLLTQFHVLSTDLRKALIQNVVLLRNKGVITAIELLQCLFPLLPKATSSNLQGYLRDIIVTDIRKANIQSKNHKLNNAVQAMLFAMVDHNASGPVLGDKGKARHATVAASGSTRPPGEEALWAIIVASDLWKRQIWVDAKTITIISLGCFHPVYKVQSAAAHFFLGSEDDEESDDESTHVDVRALQHRREINKKTRSADKKFKKAVNKQKSVKKKTKKAAPNSSFPALDLLQDPQAFAERLYGNLNQNDRQFSLDHKILLLQLLSRVMAAHKLCVLGFYSYIMKYLAYRQIRVPSILAALAQSVHDLTPPDVLIPIVKKLAQEFVHPGVSGEVITAGINSIREVCRRQPWAIEEDLLGDLVEYRRSRDKSVVSAARGLLQLYREVNPSLLRRRERGKEASINTENRSLLPFGHRPSISTGIEGLGLLEEHLADQEDHDDGAWGKWKMDSDLSEESDSSQGWIDVSDDGQDLALSDSDSENEADVSNTQTQQDSKLAQTKILTPDDFTMLNALRLGAAKKATDAMGSGTAKRKVATLEGMQHDALSDGDILGPRKKAKADYEERLASIHKGREGREKYGSRKGKDKEPGSSTTNKEKAKNKPVMMILSSGSIRGKQKVSLRDKQKKLRAHIARSRKSR